MIHSFQDNSSIYFFIVNPKAGGHRSYKRWPSLQQELDKAGISYQARITEYKHHAGSIVHDALSAGYRKFVVVGGDGTVNELVNGLFQQSQYDISECMITVMPWGTGNDWAAYYSLPARIRPFVDMLQSPNFHWQDVGRVTYTDEHQKQSHYYFVNFVGAGYDSYTLEQMSSGGGNRLSYFYHVLKSLHTYQAPEFTLSIGSSHQVSRSLMNMVCIGRYGGGGMKFSPTAQTDDGLYNIVSISDMPLWERIKSLPYLFNGKIDQHTGVNTYLGDQLKIKADKRIAFQCDGEVVGFLPVDIDILTRSLRVIVP